MNMLKLLILYNEALVYHKTDSKIYMKVFHIPIQQNSLNLSKTNLLSHQKCLR